MTPFSQNEEQINKLQATGGEGFDLCQPTRDRAPQFKDLGVLAPFDMNKLKNVGNLIPSMLEGSTSLWTWDDGLYHLPHVWGTEAISWRTDKWKPEDPAALSYGALWDEDVKGHVQGRPHSLLLGIGLWMDGTGKLPSNRMLDAFKDPGDLQEDLRPDPSLRDRAQAVDQAVLGFGRQHQVGPPGERRVDRPDLGWTGAHPQERRQARDLSGAEGRRHHLDRRSVADQGRQERRPGL